MATIIVETKWPAASAEKLAKTWLEMGDVYETYMYFVRILYTGKN